MLFCPQELLRAAHGHGRLGDGRVRTLAVEAGRCRTADVYRLLQGAAATLPYLASLSIRGKRAHEPLFDASPPPTTAPTTGFLAQVQLRAQPPPPASLLAPLLRLSSLARLSCDFASVPASALQAAIGDAARMAPLVSLSLSCGISRGAIGADLTLDLTPLASLRHLEELHMEGCSALKGAHAGDPVRGAPVVTDAVGSRACSATHLPFPFPARGYWCRKTAGASAFVHTYCALPGHVHRGAPRLHDLQPTSTGKAPTAHHCPHHSLVVCPGRPRRR